MTRPSTSYRWQNDRGVGDDSVAHGEVVLALNRAARSGLRNGLKREENEELFTTENLDRIVYLLMQGLTARLR
jgi:hypothetical protein